MLNPDRIEPEIVWAPFPGSSQEKALNSPCHHTLYTGTRGPGKTDTQLMSFRQYVGQGYGSFWRGILFDREYKMLDDLVSKSKRWFLAFDDGAQWLSAKSDYRWVWPTGEELLFRSINDPEAYWLYHGQEFPFIGWNELCKYPTGECYESMMSCNRSSFSEKNWPIDPKTRQPIPMPEIPLRVFSTTNSYGPGHHWVKRRFITPAPYGQIIKKDVKVFDPRTQQEMIVTKTQVAIFGSYKENIYLSPEYIAELESITDENKRKAWLYGSWDIVAGGALSDVWRNEIHVKRRFKIPDGWYIDRSMDWGSSTPAWIGWWAEANGEEVQIKHPDGRIEVFTPQAGSLILIDEWYLTKEIGTNVGLKLSAKDVALGVIEKEAFLTTLGFVPTQPVPGPADNQIRNVTEAGSDTIEKKMLDEGVLWEESDKSRGSRKIGLQLARDRLEASVRGEGPGLYFFDNCRAAIEILTSLPRNPEDLDDVDTDAEDHPWDGSRFRILKGNDRYVKEIEIHYPR